MHGSAQRRQAAQRAGLIPSSAPATTVHTKALVVVNSAPSPIEGADYSFDVHSGCVSYPVSVALHGLPYPPSALGVAKVEAWVADLNLRCALGLERCKGIGEKIKLEQVRLSIVCSIVRELGRLRDRAFRAEQNLKLRRVRLGEPDGQDQSKPPLGDPVAILLWSFHRLAALAYDAAVSADWAPDGRIMATKAYALAGLLQCMDEQQLTVSRVKARG